ncbi:membrane protein [Brevibacillus panacihumi W25]|uniref:Membrane protein n=1 Tax=Brevibacillus panacihumi W25 TaxID=1408254 RepID=V6MK46_9BACL|nr:hemolysin family protein [Brevibacillus panacihumi]EST55833.1 membrane protein [Brevibacillus panacihumi W25]
MLTINLLLIAFLIVATAFFVATEFAIVKLRPSRVDQLVMEGRKNALAVQKVISNLDGYLSACQLGITLTAIGLGVLGKPTVETILGPVLQPFLPEQVVAILSFVIAYSIVTFLHVVVGELAPKTVAIQKAEAVSMLCAKPIIWFYKLMYPAIWLLNGSAAILVRSFGMKPTKEHEESHSEEELRIILAESYQSGKINQSEYGYVRNIFAFDELLAREIMVPRTDMSCLHLEYPLEQNLRIIKDEQYTRFPVVSQNKDHIVGMIHTKEFFLQYADNPNLDIATLIRPFLTVSEAMPVKDLLKKMQKQGTHIAILVDEYGGTSGMVTIEDILEEIVGEIRDEFDNEEKAEIEIMEQKNHVIVDGKVLLSEVNDLLDVHIDEDKLDTIGGWLYSQNPTLKEGVQWQYDKLVFTIRKKEKHRIRKIEIRKTDHQLVHQPLEA